MNLTVIIGSAFLVGLAFVGLVYWHQDAKQRKRRELLKGKPMKKHVG